MNVRFTDDGITSFSRNLLGRNTFGRHSKKSIADQSTSVGEKFFGEKTWSQNGTTEPTYFHCHQSYDCIKVISATSKMLDIRTYLGSLGQLHLLFHRPRAYPLFTRTAKIGPIFVVHPKKIGKFLSFHPILCNRI
jgi:hypothetical protein